MTDAEQARTQALELVEWFYRFAHVNEDGQCEHVLKFMATVRAEGRRKLIDSIEQSWCDGLDPDEKAERIVQWCRAQAKEGA